MTESQTLFKVYPSSAAWMPGPVVQTTYYSGCLRYIWAVANAKVPRIDSIDPAAQALGALNEKRLEAQFRRRRLKFETEVPFNQVFRGIDIRGRMDYVVHLKEGDQIGEQKATTSAHVLKDVIQAKQPADSHMAQLVTYLAFSTIKKGWIQVDHYQLSHDFSGFISTSMHKFDVELLDSGVILVDGQEYKYVLKDLARWYSEVEKVLSNPDTIPMKPSMNPIPYKNPCHFCGMRDLCAKPSKEYGTAAQFLQDSIVPLSTPAPKREWKFTRQKETEDVQSGD